MVAKSEGMIALRSPRGFFSTSLRQTDAAVTCRVLVAPREDRPVMQQQDLRPPRGARRDRKRRGRGDGSGRGSYSGRGIKGQKARTGGGVRPGFEGGQLALNLRLPIMRGFTNIFRIEYACVNLDRLAGLPADSEVTPRSLVESGAIKDLSKPVKVLGRGEIGVPLAVHGNKFSGAARRKIEAAGGSVKEIG